MQSLDGHNRRKELFEVVLVDIPPEFVLRDVIPKPEYYDPIVRYLSRKVMRGQRVSPPYKDLIDGAQVKRKDLVSQIAGLAVIVREVHEADAEADTSLKRIYVGDHGLGIMEDPVSGTIAPRKLAVYDARANEVHHVLLEDFPAGAADEEAYKAADLELAAGSTETGSLMVKHQIYLYLSMLANMLPPRL